ncbi:hypothetical protein G7Y89_g5018 [Cudoniella acicularis]|uniref:Uncharacterized protein n=1 Tax=Cudoniella acicularis TaxID=354080 RepID=A0A8H4RQC0_9HELO|nr:hypothetical protein G7Y89_g5018 [Cudoniella acicularis]
MFQWSQRPVLCPAQLTALRPAQSSSNVEQRQSGKQGGGLKQSECQIRKSKATPTKDNAGQKSGHRASSEDASEAIECERRADYIIGGRKEEEKGRRKGRKE